MRWRKRAEELKATEPDPSVLVRAITRLTARVLDSHRELSFRIALARSTLMVDTRPTKEVVGQFSTHLLAEIEQVAHMEKRTLKAKNDVLPKVKKIEEDGRASERATRARKPGSRTRSLSVSTSRRRTAPDARKVRTAVGRTSWMTREDALRADRPHTWHLNALR